MMNLSDISHLSPENKYNKALEAELVCIGDELVRGDVIDANSSYLARRLSAMGIKVVKITIVGDDEISLVRVLEKGGALRIFVGGLGPTFDDITRKVTARVLKRPLILNQKVLEDLKKRHLNRRGVILADLEKQALFPLKAEPIPNTIGTAWGFFIAHGGDYLFFLPGVPKELKEMFEHSVVPFLSKEFRLSTSSTTYTFRIFGLEEARVEERIKGLIQKSEPRGHWNLRAIFPEIWLDLSICGEKSLKEEIYHRNVEELKRRLYPYLFSCRGESVEEIIGISLRERGLKLFLAESCTGGLIGHMITSIPGSSDYFKGSIVAYHNEIKEKVLGVSRNALQDFGAVSGQVAHQMAEGARRYGEADIGLGVTGIAGPGGGEEAKPVGLVYIALSWAGGSIVRDFHFSGDRSSIKQLSARWALEILRRHLDGIKV